MKKKRRNWKRIISNTLFVLLYGGTGFGVPLGFGITFATQNTHPWYIFLCGIVIGAFVILTYPVLKLLQWLKTRTLKNKNLQADLEIKKQILEGTLNNGNKEQLQTLNNLNLNERVQNGN